MRVLVSTTAGSGHFGPLVPFARACAAAGHDVAVAAPASFAADVAAAGFQHRPFADAPPDLIGAVFGRVASLSFDDANQVVVAEVFGRIDAQAAVPGLRQTIQEWQPDLVLREPCEFGSLVAAISADVPLVTVAIGVGAATDQVEALVAQPLAELDALAGLPDGASATAVRSTPTLTCVPAALDGPWSAGADSGPLHRFRDGYPGSDDASLPPAWGAPQHPLVYVSFGSVAARLGHLTHLYPAVLAAFADRPVRLLVTTGEGMDPGDLAPLPANARVERWWPQADVMPYAAAVVGHGGFGTTMAALRAGVPQVVVPLFAFDQRINAEHVAAVGAGLSLDAGPAAVADLPDAVTRLLASSSYRDAARAVAAEMAALPPVADAVQILERVAAR